MTSTSHSITIRAVLISLPAAIPVLMVPTRMSACHKLHTNSECCLFPTHFTVLFCCCFYFNFFFLTKISFLTHPSFGFYCMLLCMCVGFTCTFLSSLSSIHVFVDNPLCVSVPPHDVKRMAWNSTGNSSCPDSELSQSSMPAAPLGSNTVAAINNTKQSKNTVLTNLPPAFPCRRLTVAAAHLNRASQTLVVTTSD